MATFVLVPGFWLGAWAWQRVTRFLRAVGHDVYPMTLTGLADRVHLGGPDVGLDTHITDIVNRITFEDLREVVLVGHSGAGAPITGAADRIPERLARLVYVDSGPLPDGTAQFDINPPEEQERIERRVKDDGAGWQIPVPDFDPAADPVNLAGLSADDLELMRTRGVGQPFATATQPLRLTNPARRAVPADMITCTFPIEQVRAMLAGGHPIFAEFEAISDHRLHELPTGHWPMFSRPADLADLLSSIGGGR
jgi:pimeloyl-ACP methyl ester carboxylesterase